jgi:catechol 2,3-dioxygenase-like lactoylglutathione lyase family enzyme
MASPLGFDGGLALALGVRDRKESARWYQEVLGFTLLFDSDEMAWCELATEVSRVTIGFSDVETPQVGGGATPTFGVRDLDAARAQLEARGVRFDGPSVSYEGMVKLATFYDPDGHTLMLYQDLQPQPSDDPSVSL